MKNLIYGAAMLFTITSCTEDVQPEVINTTDGFYQVDLLSASTAGWAGGINSSETFDSLCIIAFDYGTMYTMTLDSVVTEMPILGVNYETQFKFVTELTDTSLEIGAETWYLARISNGDVHITRYTNYNGMGQDIQTMILTEL